MAAKHMAKGRAGKHRTAVPGKEHQYNQAVSRPNSARSPGGAMKMSAAAAAKSGALTERLIRPTESAKIKHEQRLLQVQRIRKQAASHVNSAFQLYSRPSIDAPDARRSKRPVHAAAHTPAADGIFRAAAALEAAKANGAVGDKGPGTKVEVDRPWRKIPEGYVDRGKPKAKVPKFVDPETTMNRWKKRWELKIQNDPDLKVMRVRLGDNMGGGGISAHGNRSPEREPSPHRGDGNVSTDSTLSPVPPCADASVMALTAVHLIRENQRERMKQYNQSLVRMPTPRSAERGAGPSVGSKRASSAGPIGRGSKSPGIGSSQEPPSLSEKMPRQDTSSFDAATRHIARQRAAIAARLQRTGAGVYLVSSQERGDHTPELSKSMRAAGTAGNARRGVKSSISGGTPRGRARSSAPAGLGEKFHLLEAHLCSKVLDVGTLYVNILGH